MMNYAPSLKVKAAAELELRKRNLHQDIDNYESWLRRVFPNYFSTPFGPHHREFWQWASDIEEGVKPPAYIAIWARGSGKSTNTEALPIYLFFTEKRSYCWYISETQAQADQHVQNIGSMLQGLGVDRKVDKYGHSHGWRRNRLWAEGDLVIDSLGLDTARRGVKADEQRPQLLIFDDIDGELDTIETTIKKETVIRHKILPAGDKSAAVVFAQNLVIPHGIVSQLYDGDTEWLYNRTVSGPHPAIEDLETEKRDGRNVIVSGTPTWQGQDIDDCQGFIDEWGLSAFEKECQHLVFDSNDQIFSYSWWDGKNRYDSLQHDMRFIFCDTAFKDKTTSDPSAIGVFDLDREYRLALRYMWNERIQSADLPEKIEEIALRWGKVADVIVEDRGSGTTTIQTLRNTSPKWMNVREYSPKGPKEYRARNASVWCARDCVLLHKHVDPDFADPYKGQLFRFPNAPHDDMVDVFTMAILYLENYIKYGWQIRTGRKKRKMKNPYKDSRIARHLRN